jgi:hypothetical protein
LDEIPRYQDCFLTQPQNSTRPYNYIGNGEIIKIQNQIINIPKDLV